MEANAIFTRKIGSADELTAMSSKSRKRLGIEVANVTVNAYVAYWDEKNAVYLPRTDGGWELFDKRTRISTAKPLDDFAKKTR